MTKDSEMGQHYPKLGSPHIAQALHRTVSVFDGDPNSQRADMRHTTISGHHHARHTLTAAFWIVAACWIIAGIVAVIALGSGLTRLAVALAIVTTDWWVLSEVVHRFDIRS
jgi:hypothetical protein